MYRRDGIGFLTIKSSIIHLWFSNKINVLLFLQILISFPMKIKKIISLGLAFIVAVAIFISCEQEKTDTITEQIVSSTESQCPHQTNAVDTTNMFFPNADSNSCVSCHKGIDHIRDPKSGMMQEIYALADKAGYKNNECIVCHGGNAEAYTQEKAHSGSPKYFKTNKGPKEFYPNPSSLWINENTCGMCHQEQVMTQFTSLMFTEAGKIQGTAWSFGALQGYEHNVANLAVKEVDYHKQLGTDVYKKYMLELKAAEPQVFPDSMKELPQAPNAEQLDENPGLAAYSYLRAECQRCHTGVKGHNFDGDYRGAGCASCHIPYSGKGLYEGGDAMIDRTKAGKLLVHSIQSSRDAPVHIHGKSYTGIPTKTCTACHNRGRRIGVSYEGLMETSYQSPFMSNGDNQAKIHKKNYIHLKADLHLGKGMVCQDCHTSGDMHSMGNLAGAIQGAVEIECEDCHGTPTAYPWELPIGYGDEIVGEAPKQGEARGLAQSIPDYLKKGSEDCKKDGYLITARGNPMPHVVKNGNEIILYSAGGKDLVIQPLRKLTEEDKLSQKGKVAMVQVHTHVDKLECYACHATWAPQCYGCHVNIDYSNPQVKTDWVEVAKHPNKHGETIDAANPEEMKNIAKFITMGKITEQRSYLRWEDPPLVVNGDHRISTAIPGCQTIITVTDQNGNKKLLNHIYKIPNVEGAGEEGQLAIDIAPVQPHTVQKEARECESCHSNPKAMGYGIAGGKLMMDPSKDYVMDLTDNEGNVIPFNVDTQFNAIDNLTMDLSQIINDSGKQMQTVGHHFTGSRPLNSSELNKLDRRGVCQSCHQTIPDGDMATDLMSHVAKYADVDIDNKMHKGILHKSILISAWAQVLGGVIIGIGFMLLLIKLVGRRK